MTTKTKKILIGTLIGTAVIGLYFILRPKKVAAPVTTTTNTPATTTTGSQPTIETTPADDFVQSTGTGVFGTGTDKLFATNVDGSISYSNGFKIIGSTLYDSTGKQVGVNVEVYNPKLNTILYKDGTIGKPTT